MRPNTNVSGPEGALRSLEEVLLKQRTNLLRRVAQAQPALRSFEYGVLVGVEGSLRNLWSVLRAASLLSEEGEAELLAFLGATREAE